MTPDFKDYAVVVVNSSGGKDSQTALRRVVLTAIEQGYDTDRVVVSHQDLGRIEWSGTRELAERQAAHYGLRFEVSSYTNQHGESPTLLDYAIARGKWPSNSARWCTSEFKRAPGNRVLTRLGREFKGSVLQVFGFRAEESPNREKKSELCHNCRASSGIKPVDDWLPIHKMTEEEVWSDIRESGVASHHAYSLGMPRLSCCVCIFAPPGALMIAARHNPELFQEYLDAERRMGHGFTVKTKLADIAEMLDKNIEPGEVTGAWNM